ncbi:hypothetical protein ACQEVF_25415 [Nonomuraea polychroma]|uniref:hypothetical protein n=1 Tax=Nonomuraea polychroma TaxID=46176 RepID=UPI003D8D4573
MPDWSPWHPRAARLRVHQTSCCGEYELAAEGGQYFVLRQAEGGSYVETARGAYAHAAQTYVDLTAQHRCRRRAS